MIDTAASGPVELTHRCENIGPRERARRIRVGVYGSVLVVVISAALVAMRAGWPVRLLIAVPTIFAAMGFIQARAHTCVAFAMANIKVLGDSRADRIKIVDPAETAAFRKRARQLYAQGFAVTAVVVALVLLLP